MEVFWGLVPSHKWMAQKKKVYKVNVKKVTVVDFLCEWGIWINFFFPVAVIWTKGPSKFQMPKKVEILKLWID